MSKLRKRLALERLDLEGNRRAPQSATEHVG
jgi:hypothetical protein